MAVAGFEVALLATLVGLVGAGLVATRDAGLHRLPIRAREVAAVADALTAQKSRRPSKCPMTWGRVSW